MQTITDTPAIIAAARRMYLDQMASAERHRARIALRSARVAAAAAVLLYLAFACAGLQAVGTAIGVVAVILVTALVVIRQVRINSAADYTDQAARTDEDALVTLIGA